MIRFLKQHPWRCGVAAAIAVLGMAVAVVMYVRDANAISDPTATHPVAPAADPHAGHAAVDPHAGHADPHAGHAAPLDPMDPHAGHGAASSAAAPIPAGYAPIQLEPSQVPAMGLTTEVIAEREFRRTVRTVGVVAVDETRTVRVHTRVRGWIEGYHVQYVGRRVRQGEPLVSIYSQEVFAAQLELASLLKSPIRSPELLDAARKRLSLWEVPRAVIDRVERTGEPQRTVPVLAPRTGTVIAKQAADGLFVDPSLELYTISDLSRVWVLADLYEADVPHVRVGSVATLRIEGAADPLEAKVTFLEPTIDERTRTRKARFEIDGKHAMPGAFATVELELSLARGLAVPESAVIRTGTRAIVFVVHGTHIQPREIELGTRAGRYYRIESGLVAGEVVATGAQFLLDSESRLRATGGGGGHVH